MERVYIKLDGNLIPVSLDVKTPTPDEFLLKQYYSVQEFEQLIGYLEIDTNVASGNNITNVRAVAMHDAVFTMNDLYTFSYYNGELNIADNNYDYVLNLTEDSTGSYYPDILFVFNDGALLQLLKLEKEVLE